MKTRLDWGCAKTQQEVSKARINVRCIIIELLLCRLLLRTNVRDKTKALGDRARWEQRIGWQCHYNGGLHSDPRRRDGHSRSSGAGPQWGRHSPHWRRIKSDGGSVRRRWNIDREVFRSWLGEQNCRQDGSGRGHTACGPRERTPVRRYRNRRLITRQESSADFFIPVHSLPAFGAASHMPSDIGGFLVQQLMIDPSN
jgi:hypothetical protein